MIFLAFILGIPLLLLIIALVGGHAYRGGEARLLDWRPTRSAETELSLQTSEVEQLRAALKRLRRRRAVHERRGRRHRDQRASASLRRA
jgi:hypothetical protein